MSIIRTIGNNPARPKGNRVFAIGDSITAHGYTAQNTMPYAQISTQAYLIWGCVLSQGRMVFTGVSATSGYTASQIRQTHLPVALAQNPAACVVLAGTNDIGKLGTADPVTGLTVTLSTIQTELNLIYQSLSDVGIVPVACTLPPISSDSAANVKALNRLNVWITRNAYLNGFPVADFYSHLTDTATGNWLSGYSVDTLHPNGSGAKAMGEVLSDVLCGTGYITIRPQTTWLPPVFAWLPTNNLDTANLISNGLMLNSGTGRPTGWSLGGGTPGAESVGTDATTLGNYYSLTGSASNPNLSISAGAATTATGDLCYVAARFGATVEATSSTFDVRFESTDGTQDFIRLNAWDKDVPAGSVLAYEFSMPATGNQRITAYVRCALAAGVLQVGQVAALNLTAASIS